MRPLDVIRHPFLFAGITAPEFLRWYFFAAPVKIMKRYVEYLRAFMEIFSFIFLLRTLFAPWRQIRSDDNTPGFNLERFMQDISLGLVSRSIGFIARVIEFVIGLMAVNVLTAVFGLYYMGWITFPLWFVFGLTYLTTAL